MRKIITLLFLAAFCICSQAYSQNRADELMKQLRTCYFYIKRVFSVRWTSSLKSLFDLHGLNRAQNY